MKTTRPKLKTVCDDEDLSRIVELIEHGATYSQAAAACGVRPSALRRRKHVDVACELRLRAAWKVQGARLAAQATT